MLTPQPFTWTERIVIGTIGVLLLGWLGIILYGVSRLR
jgi:hypothetical protein